MIRVYRVHLLHDGTSLGYRWHTAKRHADKLAAAHTALPGRTATVTPVEIPPGRAGLVDALNRFATHEGAA